MDAIASAAKQSNYVGHGEATVSPVITLIILITGVVGGLFIVVCVIIFCKYCVKAKKHFRRQHGVERERHFRPLQRYETINSDAFSEASSASLDDSQHKAKRYFGFGFLSFNKSHDNKLSESEDVDETTHLKSDFEKAHCHDDEAVVEDETKNEPKDQTNSHSGGGRRVSFQLDEPPKSKTSILKDFRRYTEGDFHHLKRSKIDRSVHRQYSTGVASINGSRNWFDEAALRASIEEQFKEARRKSKPEIIPMVDLNESPSPPMRPVKTEIAVEVHHQQNHRVLDKFVKSESLDGRKDFKAAHPQCVRVNAIQKCSHSLDTTTPSQSRVYRETRKVKSYEDVPDYDVLKITEFSKGPCYNTDFEIISELGSSLKCKVSYNDTGSLEQLNEEQVEYLNDLDLDSVMLGDSDETETLNGTQKYRELWNLRATLEEEDECSDTIRMEDMTSPEESPDREPCTTSFESNAEAPSDAGVSDQRDSGIQWESSIKASAKHLLHPNYENRRQNYKSILTRRLQKAGPNTSTENSFDSVETDGDISDTSRYEVTTTSFESTTDNTDSTTESQTSRLRQMKTDSGYKSLETQQSAKEGAEGERDISPGTYQAEKQIQKALQKSPQKSPEHVEEAGPSDSPKLLFKRCGNASHFERRNGKTASKKRRAYSRERQMVRVYESINEPETDSKSELPSGDSFEDNTVPNKISVFARFFKFHSREYRERYLTRDYSIDEKTNKIFNDFIRHDSLDPTKCGVRRSPKLHHRHRLQRKHTEPVVGQEQRRNRLAPDMRSASLGSDSSASSVRRPSPQDSIEEEECIELISGAPGTWEAMETQEDPELASAAKPVHDIPIIKLPEEETAEVSQT